MNSDPTGFSVDPAELKTLAAKADTHAEILRSTWKQDWFEDDKWPETDLLRNAVITYRRSLRAAMERLGVGTDQLATHLRNSAEMYRDNDVRAARRFERLAGTTDVERVDGGTDA